MKKKLKILMLDVDGVLNSPEDWIESEVLGHPYNGGTNQLNRTKIALLECLIKQTKAKIVLSSAWRKYFSLDEFHELLVERGSKLKRATFLGVTGERRNGNRGVEIQDWLDSNSPVDSYAVVDDCDDGISYLHKDRFVQTDGTRGLSLANIYKLEKILKS